MIIKKIFVLLIIPIMMFSCAKEKVEFTVDELSWIDVYEENDVIIFQNIKTLEKDTTVITKKEVYHPEYDWIQHDKYQPQVARLWCKNSTNKDENYELLELWKTNPYDKVFPSIRFKKSGFITRFLDLRFQNVTLIDNKSFSQVYIFDKEPNQHFDINRHGNNPQSLYWDKEYGIIKYVTYKGDVWERINFNNDSN